MQSNSTNFSLAPISSWGAYLEIIAFLLIGCFGIYAALHTGINYDEAAEFQTYLVNIGAIKELLHGGGEWYSALAQYQDRYYGIGFHIFSHGLGGVLSQIISGLLPFSEVGSRLIWGHLATFLIFLASGLLFRACLLSLTEDRVIASLGMFTFLLWPYLFGHALMNVKDIPFLFGWLCCTYLALEIFSLSFRFSRPLAIRFILLGLLTGWLTSIRVSGVLIFVEYFWFAIFWYLGNCNDKDGLSLRQILGIAGVFLVAFAVTLFIFYPILWHQPNQLIQAILYMGSHPWQGDTLTAGELIEPKTRLLFYIASWLMVKLPIFVIGGLLATPFLILRDFLKREGGYRYSAISALSLAVFTIAALLITKRAALYNELRQVLFIAPLLMLISIVTLHSMSRGLAIFALAATSLFMLIDDIQMHPYQYAYINEIARNTDRGKKYDTDYYGLAIKETAIWLNDSNTDGKSQCLYVPSKRLWEFVIDPVKFPCVDQFPGDLSLIKKPFLFFVQSRSVTSFKPMPWCNLLHVEDRVLPFSGATLGMGELYECIPSKSKAH